MLFESLKVQLHRYGTRGSLIVEIRIIKTESIKKCECMTLDRKCSGSVFRPMSFAQWSRKKKYIRTFSLRFSLWVISIIVTCFFPDTRGLGRVTCSALSQGFALPNKRKIKRNYYFYAIRSSKNQNYHFPFKILLLSEIYPINIHFEKNRALDILNGRRLIAKMLNKRKPGRERLDMKSVFLADVLAAILKTAIFRSFT